MLINCFGVATLVGFGEKRVSEIFQFGVSGLPSHGTRDEMLKAFGPFAVVFRPMGDNRTPYLSLLHLQDQFALDVVRAIRDAVASPESATCVLTLLRDENWRPHLVGAIAAFYSSTDDVTAQLWAALDSGSWGTPQVAGILSRCDPLFVENASARLVELCPLSGDPEYSIESPVERHSAQGPAGKHHRSSKAAASLLALIPNDAKARFSANVELQTLIADDLDGSAAIATSWLARFVELDAQL